MEIEKQEMMGADIEWLAEKVLEERLDVRVLPQLHKIIWGDERGV